MSYFGERFRRNSESAPDIGGREQHSGMQNVQNLETIINEGLRVALLEETPDQSLEVLLEHLGKALNGERTYIFERNESGGDDNTYEWVASGITSEKENLQNVPSEVCAIWYRNFRIGRNIVIENLEETREEDPLMYETLKPQNIQSLVVVPLFDSGTPIGFYGVDNPPAKMLEYASNMLQTAAYFIVSSLKRRNLVRELQKRSYRVLHALSVDYLGKEGAYLDDIVFCPHHPDRGYPEENPAYKTACNCRKPAVGMIHGMAERYHIDLSKSYMVGDSTVDIQTGINAGLKTILVRTGQAGKDGKYKAEPDCVADDLEEAADYILRAEKLISIS